MQKIVTIVGARPQFIKAAVISRAITKYTNIKEIIIHTGQHYDENMSNVFFEEMDIPLPDYNLNINSLSHGAMTGQMLEKIEKVLLDEKPDWVLVYGDTNSTLAGALAAKKLHIKVAHVEAGLRSFNMNMPEEINRILTDRISDVLFCPTETAIKNLQNEGYDSLDITYLNSGDVMQDAALYYTEKARKPNITLPDSFNLCTVHRAENTDAADRLNSIMEALESISKDTPVVMSIHPRTKKILKQNNYDFFSSSIIFIDPVGYLEMVWLSTHSKIILTDSGGLQKEAYFFKKRCITLRDETEWIELVKNGFNYLVGSNKNMITNTYLKLINMKEANFDIPLYGDGKAGERIVNYFVKNGQ